MNERLVTLSGELGEVGVTLGDGSLLVKLPPVGHKLVYASFTTDVDDADVTVDIQDDGTDIVTAVAVVAAATPGVWNSKNFGGVEDPVLLAGSSVLEIDVNNADANTRLRYLLYFLVGGS